MWPEAPAQGTRAPGAHLPPVVPLEDGRPLELESPFLGVGRRWGRGSMERCRAGQGGKLKVSRALTHDLSPVSWAHIQPHPPAPPAGPQGRVDPACV